MMGTALSPAALRDVSSYFPAVLEQSASAIHCRVGETIYYEGRPADYYYRLSSGAARKSALMPDGRRRIISFLLPGELFGFGAHATHRFSVEALAPGTVVVRYPRQPFESFAATNAAVGRQIREAAFDSIAHLQTRMVLLGRSSALEKVSGFLLEMIHRSATEPDLIFLPMSRYDIADYLAIAVETVSRSLTRLTDNGAIAFKGTRLIV